MNSCAKALRQCFLLIVDLQRIQIAYWRKNPTAARITGRCILFSAAPGTTVNNLLATLGVTKQSLNRVLRTLIEDGLVLNEVGTKDKRQRHLSLTDAGRELEQALSNAQRDRMRSAYRQAGAEAVHGFCTVLEAMMDPELKKHYDQLTGGETV